jgi:hypothetical protein
MHVLAFIVECWCRFSQQTKQQTQKLWMWRMEHLHHEQRPLVLREWF